MINFKALVRTIQSRKRVDADTAWSAIAQAYLKLDTTRPETSQASYLMKVGCFYVYPEHGPDEVSIDDFSDIIPCRRAFDEESFMRALSIEGRAVADAILNGQLETTNERSVRRILQNNQFNYSRAMARKVIYELQRTSNNAEDL